MKSFFLGGGEVCLHVPQSYKLHDYSMHLDNRVSMLSGGMQTGNGCSLLVPIALTTHTYMIIDCPGGASWSGPALSEWWTS